MRSSALLTSALAAAAIAGPIERRKLYTEIEVIVETVTLYVTVGPTASGATPTAGQVYGTVGGVAPSSPSSSSSVPVPASETPSVVPQPTSTSSSSRPTVFYQTVQIPTTVVVPTTSSTSTTSAAPTTTAVPTTSSTSSSAAPSSSAPSFGVEHVSGTVQATFSSGQDYKDSVLWHHNRARANHNASNLEWSSECEAAAKTAAE